MIPNQPKNTPRFRGIRLPPGYENTLQEAVERDLQDPEDTGQNDPQNQLKRYGGNSNG